MKPTLFVIVLCCLALAASAVAAPPTDAKAEVQAAGSVLALNAPVRGAVGARLVVVGPSDFRVERAFTGREPISLDLGQIKDAQGRAVAFADGDYRWELRVFTPAATTQSQAPEAVNMIDVTGAQAPAATRTDVSVAKGQFTVQLGVIALPKEESQGGPQAVNSPKSETVGAGPENISVHPLTTNVGGNFFSGNVYASGGFCGGCTDGDGNGLSNELLMKSSGSPWISFRNVTGNQLWRFYADSTNFGLVNMRLDGTGYTRPLVLESNPPTNTLYLANSGSVGIGTSTPTWSIYAMAPGGGIGNPALALDNGNGQKTLLYNNTGGYTGLTNGTNCALCLTPTASVSYAVVLDGSNVGLGTVSPKAALDVNGYARAISSNPAAPASGKGIEFFYSSTNDWGVFQAFDRSAFAYKNFVLAGSNLIFYSGTSEAMRLDTSGRLGLGVPGPTQPLQLKSGAYCSAGGVWTNASSRAYKQDIQDLSTEAAEATLENLTPVTYEYKAAPGEHHVGFIAEDVPDLVATPDRKGLSSMDVVAVLTKVVQQQQKTIAELQAQVAELRRQK